ncbi:ABC transporter [cyanobacterium TDX16]|nr:ABC transporter [cyanobacterium TDX16]
MSLLPTPSYKPVSIRLENISKVYGFGETEVRALSDVNLMVEQGEYCAIMGASGSGKSTAMNIIGCLDRPTEGHYYLNNLDVTQLGDAELAHIRNLKIGFVFQQFHLLPQLSALENVMLPMVYAGLTTTERRERAIGALRRVGLENRLNNKPNQLSGGSNNEWRSHSSAIVKDHPVDLLVPDLTLYRSLISIALTSPLFYHVYTRLRQRTWIGILELNKSHRDGCTQRQESLHLTTRKNQNACGQ